MKPIEVYTAALADPSCDMRHHLPYLRSVAKGNILEIGVRSGASTSAFLVGLEGTGTGRLWSVDINPECGKLFAGHLQWTFIDTDSKNWDVVKSVMSPRGLPLDVLFIDGDHEYEGVRADLSNYVWLRPGGLILMHDVAEADPGCPWPTPLGPRKALDEFLRETSWKCEIRPRSHGLAVIEVPQR